MQGLEKKDMLVSKKILFKPFILVYIYINIFNFLSTILFSGFFRYFKSQKIQLNLFYYKYFKIFDWFQLFSKQLFLKNINIFKNLVVKNFKSFIFGYYFLKFFSIYNFFFKTFFSKYKGIFYKTKFNRLYYNLGFFVNKSYLNFFKCVSIKINVNNTLVKKYLYINVIKNNIKGNRQQLIKKKYYWRIWKVIKKKKHLKMLKKCQKLRRFVAKSTYSIALSKNYLKGVKRNFNGNNFYLKGLNYFLKWSFNLKTFFNLRLKFNYNLLFLFIFLKTKKKNKKVFNFFRYFLTAKNFLKNRYKIKKHFCFLKKVRSNSFLTVTNSFGEVIFSLTAGRLNLVTKKYKRSYPAIKLFWSLLAKKLKIFSIRFVVFLLERNFLRHFFRIKKIFKRYRRIKYRYIPINVLPHNNILKTKKLRKVKRK